VVTLESWIGSADPMAIGPFPHSPLHLAVRCLEGDVGVTQAVQDVDRGDMICRPHHPAGAVKLIPTPNTLGAGSKIDL